MKIVFFIDNLSAGGKERRFTELLKGLNQISGIQFEIVVMCKKINYQEIFDLNVKIHYLIRKTKKDISVFRKFYRICRKYKPDIIHCWNDMTAVISVPTCRLLSIKLVNGMVVDTPVQQNISNKSWLRAKFTFPFSDKIIGNSYAGLHGYNAPAKKSSCIYNGMDFTRFDNLRDRALVQKEILGDNTEGIFIVGMVADFEIRKDYSTLIKGAISLINANDSIRFVLVGGGNDFIKIKNSIPPLLKNKILLLGRRNDVESIINVFDVGILLTNSKVHGEGISNSIIEYMALGKPVIATNGGGTNEVITDNENGFLINSEDIDQLVLSIQKLMNDKNLRIELGRYAKDIAYSKFNLRIMTKSYITMYQEVLKGNKK